MDAFYDLARERYGDEDTVKQLGMFVEHPGSVGTTAMNTMNFIQKTIERIRA